MPLQPTASTPTGAKKIYKGNYTMKINLMDLLKIQKEVDAVIREKSLNPSAPEIILAFNVEFFELINEIGVWKWWKHSHVPKRDRILDELADCFAFYLKLLNTFEGVEEDFAKFIENVEEEVSWVYKNYKGAIGEESLKDFIMVVGSNNEVPESDKISTTERFGFAICAVESVFPDITWEEIKQAYQQKSDVNIKRQKDNY